MIEPTATEVLKAMERTFEKVIKPDLSSTVGRSAAATISHLLRHVALRIELEGQILHDEAARLKRLLPRVHDYLAGREDCVALADRLRSVLSRPERDAAIYPNLEIMASEVGELRSLVCDVLEFLQSRNGSALGGTGSEQLHQELRSYVAWQIEQESRIVDPAMTGRGPRR